jgi:hypothetical protein
MDFHPYVTVKSRPIIHNIDKRNINENRNTDDIKILSPEISVATDIFVEHPKYITFNSAKL